VSNSGVRGAKGSTVITAKDISAGHKEKTLALLWSVMFHWHMPTLIDVARLGREVNLLRRCYAKVEAAVAALEAAMPVTPDAATDEVRRMRRRGMPDVVKARWGVVACPLTPRQPMWVLAADRCGQRGNHRPPALVPSCVRQVRLPGARLQRVHGGWAGTVPSHPPLPARAAATGQVGLPCEICSV